MIPAQIVSSELELGNGRVKGIVFQDFDGKQNSRTVEKELPQKELRQKEEKPEISGRTIIGSNASKDVPRGVLNMHAKEKEDKEDRER